MHDSVWYKFKVAAASVIINSESSLQHLFDTGKQFTTEMFLEREWKNNTHTEVKHNDIRARLET